MNKKTTDGFIPLDTIVILREQFKKENPATYEEECCIVDDNG